MEQQSSTSNVTVEYFDPHDVYKLLAPGLIPRLPLKNLHWQSHAGPLRSIDTVHVDLVRGDDPTSGRTPTPSSQQSARDDGFQTQNLGGRPESREGSEAQSATKATAAGGSQRRHQIPGLRRSPYLKVLLVRCDDNDSYKGTVRSEIREWIKTHTIPPSTSSSSKSKLHISQEKHDAFEWLIVHVIIPSTVASTQPRTSGSKSETPTGEKSTSSTSSRWRTGSTPLLEKLKSDFNASSKSSVDRVCQVRIGVNDVPYELLPRVVPAVPTGYQETEQDAEAAWGELMVKFRSLILSSFDTRVTQYEEDIKERDVQRSLPGWNFCTFFILKEGLARGFENVGLVEDALVGYDELSIGLDAVLQEQAETGQPESHGGAMLGYTEELKAVAQKALTEMTGRQVGDEAVDLQSRDAVQDPAVEIAVSSTKKAYRDMILENKVSVFDFRCYIFARQIALLLRLSNAMSSREELLAKLKDQQDSVLHGVAPLAPPPARQEEEPENLIRLSEICRRTLRFIPSISQIMRQDIITALSREVNASSVSLDPALNEVVDNLAASFAFAVAQQVLAQTASKALPIPPSMIGSVESQEPKSSIPEPKTMMHPARTSSARPQSTIVANSSSSVAPFTSPGGRRATVAEADIQHTQFLKSGLEELAAQRAELYMLSRSILERLGSKRQWSNGWAEAPVIGDSNSDLVEISLTDEPSSQVTEHGQRQVEPSAVGINSPLLKTAVDNSDDFYRLYEILTDKALRHYTVADHKYAMKASLADLAVLKFYLKEYRSAEEYLLETTLFFSESRWSLLELSMLVMYTHCLSEVGSDEQYVQAALKLLSKSCAAEKERLESMSASSRVAEKSFPDVSPSKDIVGKLFSMVKSMPNKVEVRLGDFFTNVKLADVPQYHDGKDECSLSVSFRSLLSQEMDVDSAALKLVSVDNGPVKEVSFELEQSVLITPGENTVTLSCKTIVPGKYSLGHFSVSTGKLSLRFDQNAHAAPSPDGDIFAKAEVTLFQRRDALDVTLSATRHTALDQKSSLDLVVSTGWNQVRSCEIKIRPASGGLRLLTQDAKFVDSDMNFTKPPEAGIFHLGETDKGSNVLIRFPYTVEQDLGELLARLEVTYETLDGTYFLARSLTVPVSLVLGVNVQDVFKHNALFSRFNVSTASSSPLRLFKTELLDSEVFESEFGTAPTQPLTIFPGQPATLLYKIMRRPNVKLPKNGGKTMYLKLYYSRLQTQIEETVVASALDGLTSPLDQLSKVLKEVLLSQLRTGLQPLVLEQAALLGEFSLTQLRNVPWKQQFQRFGPQLCHQLTTYTSDWCSRHPLIAIPSTPGTDPSTILIPVEIPSLPVVHTADIKLQPQKLPFASLDGAHLTVGVNQLLPASLHLRWTRIWDTDTARKADLEFSYEVTAPPEQWLIGGRRKGHFVIPAPDPPSSSSSSLGGALFSTPLTEADIPIVLIPQRAGWLPYPAVDVHEIGPDGSVVAERGCEVDARNLGEQVRVLDARGSVTVSLDASGPGGGPLVLDGEALAI